MLTVIKPVCSETGGEERLKRLDQVLEKALAGKDVEYILTAGDLEATDVRGRKLIFAVCLSEAGINFEYYRMLEYFRRGGDCLAGCIAGIIVDGTGELFTKSLARRLTFSANLAGCALPGKSLVEATGSLYNFNVMSKIMGTDNMTAYCRQAEQLVERIEKFTMPHREKADVLVIHASSRKTSNSLLLWEMVKSNLDNNAEITEVSLRNGQVYDCRGCKYETCLHFGENGGCFYGGVMSEKVYPAIIKCDVLIMVCPNYNDAVSANITAFINRLTSVFRSNDFSSKKVYAIVVSGYSGGDIVAEQIIGAMTFNKNFILPGNFAMVETANDPESILETENLEEKAKEFAEIIKR